MTEVARRGREPLLTAAMIVRDEAEHLVPCLASLRDVVDDVVVVDTGSVDDSIAIARSFGARVYQERWANDFSLARNSALDRVCGQWVLYIDADERLRRVSRDEIEALLDVAEEVAFRLRLYPFVGSTPYREYRLWRNDPRIRFEGIIHERVVSAIRAVALAEDRPIGVCDLALDHVGYETDQTKKHHRNLPLLRAQLAAEPGNVSSWRRLSSALAALGKAEEAEVALETSIQLVRAATHPVSGGSLAYADLIRLRNKHGDTRALFDEALGRYPRDPLLLWMRAASALDTGDPVGALGWLDRLAAVDPKELDDTIAYDDRLFGALLHEARGQCLFRLLLFDAAAEAYRAAEEREPDNEEHRLKRLLAEHKSTGIMTVSR
jgi:glycosyltransferase involved in cell wall biosynthesis